MVVTTRVCVFAVTVISVGGELSPKCAGLPKEDLGKYSQAIAQTLSEPGPSRVADGCRPAQFSKKERSRPGINNERLIMILPV